MFRWEDYLKVLKLYVLIMTVCWKKVGTLFKGGHYVREDINQGNMVFWKIPQNNNPVGWKQLLKINKPVGRNKHVCWKNSSKLISL